MNIYSWPWKFCIWWIFSFLVQKFLPHKPHWYGLNFSCTLLICFVSVSLRPKCLLQMWHGKFFCFMWTTCIWFRRFPFLVNVLWQMWHSNSFLFAWTSLVWIWFCVFWSIELKTNICSALFESLLASVSLKCSLNYEFKINLDFFFENSLRKVFFSIFQISILKFHSISIFFWKFQKLFKKMIF